MAKKIANATERSHMGRVASLGCILCGKPATVHHITGAGMGLRASHFETLALCSWHHQHGSFGEAVHNGTKSFEAKYGTQRELLERTRKKLSLVYPEYNPENGELNNA